MESLIESLLPMIPPLDVAGNIVASLGDEEIAARKGQVLLTVRVASRKWNRFFGNPASVAGLQSLLSLKVLRDPRWEPAKGLFD